MPSTLPAGTLFRLHHRNRLMRVSAGQRHVGLSNHFTPNLRTTSSIDFSVSSIPSTIAAISGLALCCDFQRAIRAIDCRQRIRASRNCREQFMRFSISCSFFDGAGFPFPLLMRNTVSRSRESGLLQAELPDSQFFHRADHLLRQNRLVQLPQLTLRADPLIISSGLCPSGVFCSLLLMNFSAFFRIHLAN